MNNIREIFRIIRKLNYILDARQKKNALFVLVIIIISSGFELMGITAVLPFIQAVLTPEVLMENEYVKPLISIFRINNSSEMLVVFGIVLIMIYLFKNIFIIFSQYVQARYATSIQKDLSVKMLNSYMSRSYEFFLNTNSSEILRGCSNDVNSVYQVLTYLNTSLAEAMTIFFIGVFIILTDPYIAIGVLILLSMVFMGIVLLFKPKIKKAGLVNVYAGTQKNKVIYQCVNGIKDIFVMQRKSLFVSAYEKASEMVRKSQCLYDTLNNIPDRIIEGICVSGIIGIVCVRLLMFGGDNVDFIPKLGVFAMAAFKILPSIGKMANRINGVIYYMPGFNNVYCIMVAAEEYTLERKKYMQEHGGKDRSESSDGDLEFKRCLSLQNVVWKYDKAKEPVLTDVCLEIQKGESVAFIGASGAGKTTIADVILGLLQPKAGNVMMDGIDIYTIQKEWAHIVGYVPQTVFLTDDTVRNNVAFGIPEKEIADEEIWDALERAQLASFIKELPDGLDTVVGERGVKFSGGQRQRIVIARALYNKPEILVLDEATAALDNETETAVMESIEALQGQITMIIVAHRLTTIRNCDRIYEIRDGIAVERKKEEVLQLA